MTKTGSTIVSALESAYRNIQRRHPELPEVVVIIGSPTRGQLGHFGAHRWINHDHRDDEIFVSGHHLAHGGQAVMLTLLHEATHGLANARSIKDTSRNGRYHNRRFVKLAEELGLVYAGTGPSSSLGFSDVIMTEKTGRTYAKIIARLDEALTHHLDRPNHNGRKVGTRLLKAECPCGRIIRASATVLDGAPITCGDCDGGFT
jgi:hypothetical protein